MSRLLEFLEKHKGPFKAEIVNYHDGGWGGLVLRDGAGWPIHGEEALFADMLTFFEAMVRDKIGAIHDFDGFCAVDDVCQTLNGGKCFPDPIAAVLAAKEQTHE